MNKNTIEKSEKNVPAAEARNEKLQVFEPATDVVRTEESVYLYADVPGADDASLSVDLNQDLLTLGARVPPSAVDSLDQLYREFGPREYRRSFRLGDQVDRDHIRASIRHGVLQVELPLRKEIQPRKVNVEIA